MRVISGKYKGKRLLAPEGRGTRPTSEKVRESIFDILASRGMTGGRVLDLFAGTGALGIEALSRGAEDAVFVEKNPDAAAIARKNLASLGISASVFNTDWKVALRKLEGKKKFDIIFLDPPYALHEEEKLVREITAKNLLADGGCIVVEHSTNNDFGHDGYDADRRRYSDTSVTFLTKKHKKPRCIFPGTFDPFTLGHFDVVIDALKDYERVTVAVAETTYKSNCAPLEVRAEIASLSVKDEPRADVCVFGGMLTDFLRDENCTEVVRGVRDDTDMKYEESIAEVYRADIPDINMVYYSAVRPAVSSHAVRTMIAEEKTDKLSAFVCISALKRIRETYGK